MCNDGLNIVFFSFSVNPFPHLIWDATSVPFGNSFLLLGGRKTSQRDRLDTIYCYNPDDDSWTLLNAKLKNSACSVAAMAVPWKMFHTN
jgi:hypothetical protein